MVRAPFLWDTGWGLNRIGICGLTAIQILIMIIQVNKLCLRLELKPARVKTIPDMKMVTCAVSCGHGLKLSEHLVLYAADPSIMMSRQIQRIPCLLWWMRFARSADIKNSDINQKLKQRLTGIMFRLVIISVTRKNQTRR